MTATATTERDSQEAVTLRVTEQIEKLLRLAGKNTNEHEAASALAKAQALAEAHNLEIGSIEAESGVTDGRREDAKVRGGMYKFQQEIWHEVAELNFCLYFAFRASVWRDRRYRSRWGGTERRQFWGHEWRHRLVGRRVNVAATRAMAGYLEQTIERITRERLHGDNTQLFSRWAVSFRRGLAQRLVEKVTERRRQKLRAERQKEKEAHEKAQKSGLSTSTSLTLTSMVQRERDANIDTLYGEGTSAEWRAERQAAAQAEREAEEAYTAWAKANPEEAAKEEREAEARERRNAERRTGRRTSSSGARSNTDWSAYHAGYEKAADIGLDPQTEDRKPVGRLT